MKRRSATACILLAATLLSGCAECTKVSMSVVDRNSGGPLEGVHVSVFPPIRWLPSFPVTSGATGRDGTLVLNIPKEDRTRTWMFVLRGSLPEHTFLMALSRDGKGVEELTAADAHRSVPVRVELKEIVDSQ